MMDTGLDGKVVLITGASGGLGSQMVRVFAEEGARVVLHYHTRRDAAESLLGELGSSDHTLVGADLTREADVARLCRSADAVHAFGAPLGEGAVLKKDPGNPLAGERSQDREYLPGEASHYLFAPGAVSDLEYITNEAGLHLRSALAL